MLAIGIPALLLAQQASAPKSDLIQPEAMRALDKMGVYLRSLKDFQVTADVTSEDVLTDGEKVQFGHTTNILAHRSEYASAQLHNCRRQRRDLPAVRR